MPDAKNMPKENPNTERYITIARACLKAIKDTAENASSREQKNTSGVPGNRHRISGGIC
jgi:hypothetical protein